MLQYDTIEIVITSCRRLPLFLETMKSIYTMISDIDMVSRITCCDDSSSEDDRLIMRKTYPNVNYIYSEDKGQDKSIIKLINILEAKYVLWWEDDFTIIKKLPLISRSLNIIYNHQNVTSVIMRPCIGEKYQDEYGIYNLKQYDPLMSRKDINGFNWKTGKLAWPGWCTNCNFQKVQPLKKLGYSVGKYHEFRFSLRYWEAGYRVAYLNEHIVLHTGNTSAHDINNTIR